MVWLLILSLTLLCGTNADNNRNRAATTVELKSGEATAKLAWLEHTGLLVPDNTVRGGTDYSPDIPSYVCRCIYSNEWLSGNHNEMNSFCRFLREGSSSAYSCTAYELLVMVDCAAGIPVECPAQIDGKKLKYL